MSPWKPLWTRRRRGPDRMPITPKTGSLFHAYSQPGTTNVRMVLVGDSADAADDWIAEQISAVDVCVTSNIPLASRCLKKGARVVSPTGKQWTQANRGKALADREIARHLRELPFSKRARYGRAGSLTGGGPHLSPIMALAVDLDGRKLFAALASSTSWCVPTRRRSRLAEEHDEIIRLGSSRTLA